MSTGGIIKSENVNVIGGAEPKEKVIPIGGDTFRISGEVIANAIKQAVETAKNKMPVSNNAIKPDHYAVGGIQPLEYMKIKMSPEAYNGFLLGNVIKYVSRFDYKNGLEDLKKAQNYLNMLVAECEEGR
jgi:hypothetical protein